MNAKTIEIIKATVPVLEEHGDTITERFYLHLFETHPELNNVFNQAHQKEKRQQRALAQAVLSAAKHIDQLEAILGSVNVIAHKHRSIGIAPEHYPIVGENLLWAIKDVLGDQASDEIIDAWAIAYGEIAKVFIAIEENLREDVINQQGWEGYKRFTVEKKIEESKVITSFYLKPEDGMPLPDFKPGQYISVKLPAIPGETYTHIRQYSLSDAPGKDHFRISVKKESALASHPDGVVSNYLHNGVKDGDVVEISAPAGEFILDTDKQAKPLVLISGGIGQTPLMSMLKWSAEHTPERPVTWVHAALNGETHALVEEALAIEDKIESVQTYFCYEKPSVSDMEQPLFMKTGYIDENWLEDIIPDKQADYYFCGPKPFMRAINTILRNWGIKEDSIHFEFFGPQDEMLAEETAGAKNY